jgi:hypothetical protein
LFLAFLRAVRHRAGIETEQKDLEAV